MHTLNFDIDRSEVSQLADTGRQILQQHSGRPLGFDKQSVEQLDKWMIRLWKDIPRDYDELSDEEQELIGYLAAFLGECVICTLGGTWGRTGPFFDLHYFIRIPIPCGYPYDINPCLRMMKAYYDPITHSIRDWYLRAELASMGRLDPLLRGEVKKMIVPSVFGRAVISRHAHLSID